MYLPRRRRRPSEAWDRADRWAIWVGSSKVMRDGFLGLGVCRRTSRQYWRVVVVVNLVVRVLVIVDVIVVVLVERVVRRLESNRDMMFGIGNRLGLELKLN